MRTKLIALVFVITGLFFGLKGMTSLTIYAHLHEPGHLIYHSEIVDAIVAGDSEKEIELKEDKERARRHLHQIFDVTLNNNLTLVGAGCVNVFFGLLLYPNKKKAVEIE